MKYIIVVWSALVLWNAKDAQLAESGGKLEITAIFSETLEMFFISMQSIYKERNSQALSNIAFPAAFSQSANEK